MLGQMQDWPLTVDKILDHAAAWHGEREDRHPASRVRSHDHGARRGTEAKRPQFFRRWRGWA